MSSSTHSCATPRGSSPGRFVLWVGVAAVLLLLDQASKALVQSLLHWGEIVYVTPFFNWVHVGNTGSAFSFLGEAGGWQIWLFAGLACAVSAGIIWGLWRFNGRTVLSLALALVLSGAIGNLIDRVSLGYVVDFLDFHAFGWHWPAFNVADICICVGAALIVFEEFLTTKSEN